MINYLKKHDKALLLSLRQGSFPPLSRVHPLLQCQRYSFICSFRVKDLPHPLSSTTAPVTTRFTSDSGSITFQPYAMS